MAPIEEHWAHRLDLTVNVLFITIGLYLKVAAMFCQLLIPENTVVQPEKLVIQGLFA